MIPGLACIRSETDMHVCESFTAKSTLFKYGKVIKSSERLKIYVLSSVIPMEPETLLFNIELKLREVFERNPLTYLIFEIYNLEEKLAFQINSLNVYCELFLEKIICGEFKLKGRYCSEVFDYYPDNSNENSGLILFEDEEHDDKLFILPFIFHDCNFIFGVYSNRREFLGKLLNPEFLYKIKDVYLQINIKAPES